MIGRTNAVIGGGVTLASIAVTTPPTQTIYAVGTNFLTAGMVITATYSNGATRVITGYMITPHGLDAGTTKVTISFTEFGVTRTCTQAVIVGTPIEAYQVMFAPNTSGGDVSLSVTIKGKTTGRTFSKEELYPADMEVPLSFSELFSMAVDENEADLPPLVVDFAVAWVDAAGSGEAGAIFAVLFEDSRWSVSAKSDFKTLLVDSSALLSGLTDHGYEATLTLTSGGD